MTAQSKAITPRVVLQMILFIIIMPFLPLLISRQWDWWEAWAYALVGILGFVISRALAARRNPDIIAERAKYMGQEGTQPWDKKLISLMFLLGLLVVIVVGLDALYGWPPDFGPALEILALIALLAGYAFSSYALVENRFFSGTVRIQAERGQHVVSSGPYRWVRHPGYAGALLAYLATPFLLDSAWALIPTLLVIIVLVVRTGKEDRFLQAELDGYREYAGRVGYRLLPGVW